MAKQPQRKVLPARKVDRPDDEDSLLIRSAESLGRMIGSLQRQLRAVQLPNGDALSLAPPSAKKASRKRATPRAASTNVTSKAKSAKKAKKTKSAKRARAAARPRTTRKTKSARKSSR